MKFEKKRKIHSAVKVTIREKIRWGSIMEGGYRFVGFLMQNEGGESG